MLRALVLACVAGAILAFAPALAPAGAPPPAVRIVALQPFTVHGQGFHPRERLSLVLFLHGRHVRLVTTNRRGSFGIRFEEYATLCTAYTLRVARGQVVRAMAAHRPSPSCAALDPLP